MNTYTICHIDEVPDVFGDAYPGEMRFFTGQLGCEQVAFTYRRMPQHTGGKGSYGHRHAIQEEIYYVISGRLQFKLDDDVVELGPGTAVRVPPQVTRSVWNDELGDAELLICSVRLDDPSDDVEAVPDFWPDE